MTDTAPKKRASGRLVKLECAHCDDFTISISRTRLSEYGAPLCPRHNEPMEEAN